MQYNRTAAARDLGLARPERARHTPNGLMLRFRNDSLKDARSAERWLASLPANDPLAAQRVIVDEIH